MEPGSSESGGKAPVGPGAPPKTDPGKTPLGQPRPRPPRVAAPAASAPSPKSRKARKNLMYGLIAATVVLTGLVTWRLIDGGWARLMNLLSGRPPVEPNIRNVTDEWKEAMDQARSANKAIIDAEKKVWNNNEALTEEDVKVIKEQLGRLEKSSEKMQELLDLLRKTKNEQSQDMRDIVAKWVLVKLWILDASELTAEGVKPPEYAGVFIPLYRETGAGKKAVEELKGIQFAKEELKQRDAAGREAVRKQLQAIKGTLAGVSERLSQLDDWIVKGLALPNANQANLPDLEYLRTEMSQINMAIRTVRDLQREFSE